MRKISSSLIVAMLLMGIGATAITSAANRVKVPRATSSAKVFIITGKVTNSETKEAIEGATVKSVTSSYASITDAHGKYTLKVGATEENRHQLILATAKGYEPYSIRLTITANTTNLNIALDPTPIPVGLLTVASVDIDKSFYPYVGEKKAQVAEFTLSASGEDIVVKNITLTMPLVESSSSEYPLTSVMLGQNGEYLEQTSIISGEPKVYIDLIEPLTIATGKTETIEVLATVSSEASDADAIYTYIAKSSEIKAYGAESNSAVTVDITGYDGKSEPDAMSRAYLTRSAIVTINDIEIPSLTAPINGKDVPLYGFTLNSTKDIQAKKFSFDFEVGTGDPEQDADDLLGNNKPNFSDIRIMDAASDSTIMGPVELSSNNLASSTTSDDVSQQVIFTGDFTVSADSPRSFYVTADFSGIQELADEQIQLSLSRSTTADDFYDPESGRAPLSLEIAEQYNSSVTLQNEALSLGMAERNDEFSFVFVRGEKEKHSTAFTLTADSADDLTVKSLTLQGYTYGGEYDLRNTIAMVNVYEYYTVGDDYFKNELGKGYLDSSNTLTLNNLSWKIPAGAMRELWVRIDIANNAPTSDLGFDIFAFDITKVNAENSNGQKVWVNNLTPNGDSASASKLNTVLSSGFLYFENSDSLVTDTTVPAGSQDVLAGKFAANALYEYFTLDRLTVQIDNLSAEDLSAVSSVYLTYKNGTGEWMTLDAVPVEISGFEKPIDNTNKEKNSQGIGKTTAPSGFVQATGYAHFTDLQLPVTGEGPAQIEVYLNLASETTAKNNALRVSLDADYSTSDYAAVGVTSGTMLANIWTPNYEDLGNGNKITVTNTIAN